MSGDDTLAEYRILRTRCGVPTAEHVPGGILLHSRVDPLAEAREIAAEYASDRVEQTVLLGGGLGYLAEALAEADALREVFVIEPDAGLLQLARLYRGDAAYFSSPRIHRIAATSPQVAAARIGGVTGEAQLIIAPYFERIAAHWPSPLTGFVQLLRSERTSRVVYDTMLAEYRGLNLERMRALPGVCGVRFQPGLSVVVAAAGPSLDDCVQTLRRHRTRFVLVAVSGAVPPLRAAGVNPDWVIALEGRDAVVNDLADLPQGISIVVFESTHPQITRAHGKPLFNGAGLETRGGTTLVPALAFALQSSAENVMLVGADLGNGNRAYASGARRETPGETPVINVPPKFLGMRAALESLLERKVNSSRKVFHVLRAAPTLRGTQRLLPSDLEAALSSLVTAEEIV